MNGYHAIMQLNDPLYDGKADSVTWGRMGLIRLIKLVEDPVQAFRWDRPASIADGHYQTSTVLFDLDINTAIFFRELDSIIQQIDPNVLQQLFVAADLIFTHTQIKIQLFLVPFILQQ